MFLNIKNSLSFSNEDIICIFLIKSEICTTITYTCYTYIVIYKYFSLKNNLEKKGKK